MSSSVDDEVAALRAKAAKAREEVERLTKELGKNSPPSTTQKVTPKKTFSEVKELLPEVINEADLEKQALAWEELKASNSVAKFGSANLRTFPVSLSMLEQRTSIKAASIFVDTNPEVDLDDFKYATLFVTGFASVAGISSLAFLPPNIGPAFCYGFALLPVLFLGIGSTAPEAIADTIAVLKEKIGGSSDGEDGVKTKSVSAAERRCRHEAAHFCCGYWCGLPVRSYEIDENGVCQVEFSVSKPNSEYSSTEVAALAVTALSGLVAEVMQYNNAIGAAQDLMVLDGIFRRSANFVGAAAQQDLTRWGALTAALLLKQNNAKYEEVVQAFGRQAPLEECIAILES